MKLYFAYGANLNKPSMRQRCPRAVAVQPFYLPDHRLAFSGVATIQPWPGAAVPGALWAITEHCEQALDRFEGYPTMYRKEYIQVDGMPIMYYRMNTEEPWEPDVGYLVTIAEGYRHWHLELEDLWAAVRITQQESYQHDLQRSTHDTTGTGGDYAVLEDDVYLELGHDLRDTGGGWPAHRHLDTLE